MSQETAFHKPVVYDPSAVQLHEDIHQTFATEFGVDDWSSDSYSSDSDEYENFSITTAHQREIEALQKRIVEDGDQINQLKRLNENLTTNLATLNSRITENQTSAIQGNEDLNKKAAMIKKKYMNIIKEASEKLLDFVDYTKGKFTSNKIQDDDDELEDMEAYAESLQKKSKEIDKVDKDEDAQNTEENLKVQNLILKKKLEAFEYENKVYYDSIMLLENDTTKPNDLLHILRAKNESLYNYWLSTGQPLPPEFQVDIIPTAAKVNTTAEADSKQITELKQQLETKTKESQKIKQKALLFKQKAIKWKTNYVKLVKSKKAAGGSGSDSIPSAPSSSSDSPSLPNNAQYEELQAKYKKLKQQFRIVLEQQKNGGGSSNASGAASGTVTPRETPKENNKEKDNAKDKEREKEREQEKEKEKEYLAQLKDLKSQLESAQEKIKTYEQTSGDNNKLQNKINELLKNAEKLNGEISENKSTIDKLNEELNSLSLAAKDASSLKKELQDKDKEIDKLNKQYKELSDKWNQTENSTSKVMQIVNAKSKEINSELKDIKKQSVAIKTEMTSNLKDIHSIIQKNFNDVNEKYTDVFKKYRKEMAERRRLFNVLQELRGNIRVLCRVRPLLGSEKETSVVKMEDGELSLKATKGYIKSWECDRIFTPKETNTDVYNEVEPLITSVLDGYNVTIFAYGQTGSGKTYTMEGPPEDRGVNYRAINRLFELAKEKSDHLDISLSVSLMEIYNEEIYDLLSSNPLGGQKLEIKLEKKDGKNVNYVQGLTITKVTQIEEVFRLMDVGNKNRATASTKMNKTSSRSHCIFSIYSTAKDKYTGVVSIGKLHLIDLAGSERINKTKAEGKRLDEAKAINLSLTQLGIVIKARGSKQAHVPFRDSKLTYLLQDSLSGDAKTLMIVQISPSMASSDESFCSMNFASSAGKVELGKAAKHQQVTPREDLS